MSSKNIVVSILAIAMLSGAGGWWIVETKQASIEATLNDEIYGEWVAVSGLCNKDMQGITGIDIFADHLMRGGKREAIDKINLVNRMANNECELGPLAMTHEITILPNAESYSLGKMNNFSILKSKATGIVYFKMSRDFKKMYDEFSRNAG